ncbi:DUF2318 domain-containing protein [Microaerobacter geothermalis]|uniref:Fe-S-containing protein n=1 Tax=Microaerobacter geothermalis TaxID=674972 RepID=UPI001F44537F|nr:Fe-S-containing protein [Microaerobacter geothermalis]MCF6095165.1 DUF2318 domain-containing protein [Microaerobacter geothermalis]
MGEQPRLDDTSIKKEEFMQLAKRRRKNNFIVILLTVLIAVVGITWFITANANNIPRTRYVAGNFNIGQAVKYDSVIPMTAIEHQMTDQYVTIKLDEVKNRRLIFTEYTNGDFRLPLMSYISPAGRVVVTVSYCEPCRSETFRIDGTTDDKVLICETCGSVWRLNDLKGVWGGCVNYPPEEIPYTVENDIIQVEKTVIENWKPREVVNVTGM